MKGVIPFVLFVCSMQLIANAQEEGELVGRQRIRLEKNLFLGAGFSNVLSSNFGDYSRGINFEFGYLKRVNRIISVGGSFSYMKFKYDPSIVTRLSSTGFPANFYYNLAGDDGFLLQLKGGDISMSSFSANLKINLVPVRDNTRISVYAFAKPFIASVVREDVSGFGAYYYNVSSNAIADVSKNDKWDKSVPGLEGLARNAQISGGVSIGPGIEVFPGKSVSGFVQASFGYTLPINIVSTRSYGNDYQQDYLNDRFPLSVLGFSTINFMAGISINVD